MSTRLRALIVQHEEQAPPGLLGDWLERRGVAAEILRLDLEPQASPDPTVFDLVVSLGSEFAASDDSVPFVAPEAAMLRAAADAGVPVLGLCFGSQILARALGGRPHRAVAPEIGWFTLETRRPDIVPEGPWFEWHYDTFTVPPGASLLAHSACGPQAFVHGKCLGLQFHPEVTREIVEAWVAESGEELAGGAFDARSLISETGRRAPEARARAGMLFDAFFTKVAGLPLPG